MAARLRRAAAEVDRPRHAARPSRRPGDPAEPERVGPRPTPDPGACRFPVVGLGASAGGLQAFRAFFQAVPPDTGAAFVIIQHLDPAHPSLTAELLSRDTAMPIAQVSEKTPIRPDHVYVIPPDRDMTIRDGALHLQVPTQRRGTRLPIDFFFRSLAESCQELAIGVILSGTGTDGSLGMKEIKANGGMTIVQEPRTAQFDGMPRSAVATGAADLILPIESMGAPIVGYARHPYVSARVADQGWTDELRSVLNVLRTRLKFDFACYKPGTIRRRIHRRMSLRHTEKLPDYVQLLQRDPDEVRALFRDLFINVTGFYRDKEAWRALEKVIARIVREKSSGEVVRAWIPGCATGEEAYSVTMLFIEELARQRKACTLQVFASDVDAHSLSIARAGEYPAGVAASIPPERLRRFFTKADGFYCVNKEVRESVVFAEQNLIADPPFSKVDLIACRNLLIYLQPDAQLRVISLLHFALNDGGYLFLGSAESIGGREDLFETVSKKWRIHRRIGPTRHDLVHFPVGPHPRLAAGIRNAPRPEAPPPAPSTLPGIAQRLLLDRFAPACVVINRRREILYYSGPTDRYLTQPSGPPTQDIVARVREGLQARLRWAIRRAIEHNAPVTVAANAPPRRAGRHAEVRITVEPFHPAARAEGLLLVAFEDGRAPAPGTAARGRPANRPRGAPGPAAASEASIVSDIERDLQAARADLERVTGEHGAANEELKASNEEVMSMNEELQSANEELETSKEELQSLNEELNTLNGQLESKVAELERTSSDLQNLLASTDMAIVFLDRSLRIRRFTGAFTRLVRLIPSDLGRSMSDFQNPLFGQDLIHEVEAVLGRLSPSENEIVSADHRWFMRRVLPYRAEDDRIDGVVVSFIDITALKKAQEELKALNEQLDQRIRERTTELLKTGLRLQGVLDTVVDGIVTFDEQGVIGTVGLAAAKLFGYGAAELVGHPFTVIMTGGWREIYEGLLARYLETGDATLLSGRNIRGRRKDDSEFDMFLLIHDVPSAAGHLFTAVVRDLSDTRRAEMTLRMTERLASIGTLAAGLGHDMSHVLLPVRSHLNALDSQKLSPRGTRHVRAVRKNLDYLEQLADGLHFLARDHDGGPARPAATDLRSWWSQVGALLSKAVPGRIRVTAAIPDNLPRVRIGRHQLTQAVLNLIVNAGEAVRAARRGPRGLVRVWAEPEPGASRVRLGVTDNGEGMSEEVRRRAFELFFTTKPPGEGTGLGLALVQKIAVSAGGAAEIESEPGQGTTVVLVLPAAEPQRAGGEARPRMKPA